MRARTFARTPSARGILGAALAVAVLVAGSLLVPGAARPGSTAAVGAPSLVSPPSSSAVAAPAPAVPPSPAITCHCPHPTWVNVTSGMPLAAPPPATGVASAYDPIDNETVEFGGCLAVGPCPDNQTWVFRDGLWSNETQHADAPSVRANAAMDYDANLHAVLMYGGYGPSAALNDTWMFSNGTWTNVSWYSAAAPPAGEGAMMAFDPSPEEDGSVLFGGCVPAEFLGIDCSNATWIWEGDAGWVAATPSVEPPARGYGQMAYDPVDGAVVLFGGEYGFLGLLGDTWEFYSDQWWNVTSSAGPGEYGSGGLVYDPSLGEMLLFGGINASFDLENETFTFSNGTWAGQAPSASPPARYSFAMALDSTGTTPIVQGGENLTLDYNDTWAYEYAPAATLGANLSTAEEHESVGFTALVGGGTAPYRAVFAFGDGDHVAVTGAGPYFNVSHAYAYTGSFAPSVTITDAVGATFTADGTTLAVSAAPSVTAKATPGAGDVGVPITFTSTVVADSAPPFTYAWSFGDHATGSGAGPSHAYTAPGTYTVTLNATNAAHVVATAQLTVTVANAPTVAAAVTPSGAGAGTVETFYANVSGGQGPYTFAWQFGDGATSALPYPQHAYAGSGTYTAEVWVNDSVGGSTHATVKVTVPSSTSTLFPSLSGAPVWFWGALGALAIVAVVGSVLLVRRAPRGPKA